MGVETALAVGVGALAGSAAASSMAPKPKTPKVVPQDPVKDDQSAKIAADEQANKAAAARKQQRRNSSLLSSGGERGTDSGGKNTLGA